MMNSAWVPLVGVVLALLWLSLRVYGRLLKGLLAGHGKVTAEPFGLPDLLVVIVLGSWLGGMAVRGFLHPAEPRAMTSTQILQSTLLFGLIVGAIVFFLKQRRIAVVSLFGFRRVGVWQGFKTALKLLLAAYPLVLVCNAVMQQVLGDEAQTQEIVRYFIEAAERSERWHVIVTACAGVLIAPLCEEFFFRGYLYGVLRRHGGPLVAMVLSAALFAAIHLNLLALPALFILAICLTLAYEATGSLLVPMAMHALFNAATLGKVLWDVCHPS